MRLRLSLAMLPVLLVLVLLVSGTAEVHAATLVATLPVGGTPSDAVFDPTNGYVYVPNSANDAVAVISGTSIVANLTGETEPHSATVDTANGDVYVSLENGSVTVISGTDIVGSLEFGSPTPGVNLIYDAVNGYVYGWTYDGYEAYSGTSVVGTLPLSCDQQRQGAVDTSNGNVYLPCEGRDGGNSILVLSGTSLVANITLPYLPLLPGAGPVFDPSNGYVYIPTDYNLTVVSGTSVIGAIPANAPEASPVFDSSNGYVYMTSYDTQMSGESGDELLGVFSGTNLVANLSMPSTLYSPVVDTSNGQVFVPVDYPADGLSIQTVEGSGLGSCLTLQSAPTGSIYTANGATFDAASGYLYLPAANGTDVFVASPSGNTEGPPCHEAASSTSGATSSSSAATPTSSPSTTSSSTSTLHPPANTYSLLSFLGSIPGVALLSSLVLSGALAIARTHREQAGLSVQSPTQWLRVVSTPVAGVPFTLDGHKGKKTGLFFRRPYRTPHFRMLGPGKHVVDVPEVVDVGGRGYRFIRWSDGSTERSRDFHLLGVPLSTGAVAQHARSLPPVLRKRERALFVHSLEAVYEPSMKEVSKKGVPKPPGDGTPATPR